MTMDDLAELMRRCDAATPGPWFVHERSWESDRSEAGLMIIREAPEALYDASDDAPTYEQQAEIEAEIEAAETEIAGVMRREDATFICWARSAVPALIAELRRLRAGC